jgi:hypothetical protein
LGVLRVALVILVACDAGAREDVATKVTATPIARSPIPLAPKPPVSPPAIPSTVTNELPPRAIATLTGCWRHDAYERWTFSPDGKHGLVVVRELGDATYADRARIPHPVNYDPKSETFGFAAAGRIHGLMMLFQIEHSTLKTSVYSSHEPGSYTSTGSNWTLKRC